MNKMTEKHAPDTKADESVVLMYPDNQLKNQVRDVEETLSAFSVLKEAFFKKK